jgi:hypothetical protein
MSLLPGPTSKQTILKLGECFLQRLPPSIAKKLDRFNLNLLGIIASNFANELMMDYAYAYDLTEARHTIVEAKGTAEHVDRPLDNTSLSHCSPVVHRCLRRNAWTPFEIQQDYLFRLRERRDPEREKEVGYSGIGGCKFIAALAYDWFDRWHALNDPRPKQCLLVHKTDLQGVQLSNEEYPPQEGTIKPNMTCYRWTDGCLWVPMEEAFTYSEVGTAAAIHHAVRVTVAPSSFMVVDWSVGQFMEASLKDALLFCPID